MDTSRIIQAPARIATPILPFALHAWPARRDTPTIFVTRAVDTDGEATLVIDAIYMGHLNRQAMLGAQALLRGDDSAEQVW